MYFGRNIIVCVIGVERLSWPVGANERSVSVLPGVRWLIIGHTESTLRGSVRTADSPGRSTWAKSNDLSEGFDSGVELGFDAGGGGFVVDGFFGCLVGGFLDAGDENLVDFSFGAEPFGE